ncbi:hypothetical protein EDB92DRAFT_1819513 [Lactarius akahatsu]|uniref:Uncharacterized protein n=1 Tax=Lactarius akahatsu TaxID=416441 RepID=A0AAD4Q9U3_9AGAM|nr:hypothetical protein EDB92DRAFT_1819513 [Lactarius akahatsu]
MAFAAFPCCQLLVDQALLHSTSTTNQKTGPDDATLRNSGSVALASGPAPIKDHPLRSKSVVENDFGGSLLHIGNWKGPPYAKPQNFQPTRGRGHIPNLIV